MGTQAHAWSWSWAGGGKVRSRLSDTDPSSHDARVGGEQESERRREGTQRPLLTAASAAISGFRLYSGNEGALSSLGKQTDSDKGSRELLAPVRLWENQPKVLSSGSDQGARGKQAQDRSIRGADGPRWTLSCQDTPAAGGSVSTAATARPDRSHSPISAFLPRRLLPPTRAAASGASSCGEMEGASTD